MGLPLRHLTLLALALVAGLAFALARTASAEDGAAAPEPVAVPVAPVEAPPAPAIPAVAAAPAPAAAEALADEERLLRRGSSYLLAAIARQRNATWRWQRLMGKPLTPFSNSARRSRDPEYRRWVLRLWKKRAIQTRKAAANPPRKFAWLCIHRHEGAWNDPNPPYYGGLQMDISFQRAYRSGRGFYPWPNTARYCGLL